jgi:hypothetical protein
MSLLSESANPAEGAPGEALTVAQAADRIANKAAQPEPRERPTAPTADDEQATADQTDGGEPEEGEAPADGEAETEAETSEDDSEDETPDDNDREVTVKINGKDVKVKLSEALAGYQREADYRQKTQAAAEERRAADEAKRVATDEAARVQAERQHLVTYTDHLKAQLLGSIPTEAQLAELRRTNPTQFLITMEDIRGKVARVQGLEAQAQQAAARNEQDRVIARERATEAGLKALQDEIPDLKDPVKLKALQTEIAEDLTKAGYTGKELAELVDPRIVRRMRQAILDAKDAAQWRALQARSGKTSQRVAEAPQVARPGAAVSRTAVAETRVRDLRNKAARSGRVDDIAALIAARTAGR